MARLPEARSYIENYKLLKSKVKLLEEIAEKIIKIKSYRDELKKPVERTENNRN